MKQSAVAAAAPMIAATDLWRVFDLGETRVEALRGVTLEISAGERVAIMGHSGSGKSTLMNVLGCLDRPTRGSYRLEGREVAELAPDDAAEIRNRRIGFVFQSFNLIPRMSAIENVELPLFYGDVPLQDQGVRARAALERVGLQKRAGHMPNQLSGGEQQRVAIARALVARPPLILADEPTGNLDTRTSEEIMKLFAELNDELGVTVVLVTHEPEVAAHARRVLTFRDGRLVGDEKR